MGDENEDGNEGDGNPPGGDPLSRLDEATAAWVRDRLHKARQEAKGLRDRLKAAEPVLEEARKAEEAKKSEAERNAAMLKQLDERANAAELRAARIEVAYAKNLTPAQASRLVGNTAEELAADADVFLKDVLGSAAGKQGDKKPAGGNPLGSQPLRGGLNAGETDDPEALDPAKLAASVPRHGLFG